MISGGIRGPLTVDRETVIFGEGEVRYFEIGSKGAKLVARRSWRDDCQG